MVDLSMFSACLAGAVAFWKRVPLPHRSYGGLAPFSTYGAPAFALLFYKALFWSFGVNMNVSLVWHVLVSTIVGTVIMFIALAVDPEQCGPGVFLAFIWGAASSFVIPVCARLLFELRIALLLTEAGVPAALATCWTLGRFMHSD